MADKSIKIWNVVPKHQSVNTNGSPVGNGKKVYFKDLVMAEPNDGNNVTSSEIRVQWGSGTSFEDISGGYVSGATVYLPIEEERIGDGVKYIRVMRKNDNSGDKAIMAYLNAVEYE